MYFKDVKGKKGKELVNVFVSKNKDKVWTSALNFC